MLTSIGRFLRKLRIDHNEILLNMSEKLGVMPSFLSAVENGKKKMPATWQAKITELYDLNETQEIQFENAIAETNEIVELNIAGKNEQSRRLAVSFARKFSNLSDEQLEEIQKIISGGNNR